MTSGSAGYDLNSSKETVIAPHSRQLGATGIAITVPAGTYGRIAPRSGMSVKHSIDVGCKWGSGLLKSRLCFLTSKNHKQDYKQRGTTTWG